MKGTENLENAHNVIRHTPFVVDVFGIQASGGSMRAAEQRKGARSRNFLGLLGCETKLDYRGVRNL